MSHSFYIAYSIGKLIKTNGEKIPLLDVCLLGQWCFSSSRDVDVGWVWLIVTDRLTTHRAGRVSSQPLVNTLQQKVTWFGQSTSIWLFCYEDKRGNKVPTLVWKRSAGFELDWTNWRYTSHGIEIHCTFLNNISQAHSYPVEPHGTPHGAWKPLGLSDCCVMHNNFLTFNLLLSQFDECWSTVHSRRFLFKELLLSKLLYRVFTLTWKRLCPHPNMLLSISVEKSSEHIIQSSTSCK